MTKVHGYWPASIVAKLGTCARFIRFFGAHERPYENGRDQRVPPDCAWNMAALGGTSWSRLRHF